MYINPYQNASFGSTSNHWLRANFHTHAGTGPGSCGAYEIEDVVALYQETGYNILTISNHDYYSDVQEYADKHDMVMLNGFEYTHDPQPHMLCIGVRSLITGSHQEAIDESARQGGFVILCHPNWQHKEYWPWQEIDALSGYCGIEIFNSLIFRLSGSGLATDTWDHLLSQGKLVWGFGDDDFHRWMDLAKAWNYVQVADRRPEIVKNAFCSGEFYVSTGLTLCDFTLRDDWLSVSATAGNTYIKDNLYRFIGRDGRILAEQTGESGEYHFTGRELYLRVQVISEHGAMLWTQPIYQAEAFARP